jgi:itaconyl-CoA hydratase
MLAQAAYGGPRVYDILDLRRSFRHEGDGWRAHRLTGKRRNHRRREECMEDDFRARAQLRRKGRFFEDFSIGDRFTHHWGRTLNAGDNSLFTSLTLNFNPLYFNAEYARAHGHPEEVVCPMLVFATVFGLSVEDLSESGGAFLGVDDLTFAKSVYPRDTLSAVSEVLDTRPSSSRPNVGVVSWRTEGFNQGGERVIDFVRSNLIIRRPSGESKSQ